MIPGLILRGVGGAYWIHETNGRVTAAKPRGIFRRRRLSPLPGDRVLCSESGDDDFPYTIEEIKPRRNALVRPPVANLERCFITVALADPLPDFELVDKLGIICRIHNIEPLIVWTKTDLAPEALAGHRAQYLATGWPQFAASLEEQPVSCLLAEINGHLVSFAGASGTGKSTLTNALLGEEVMEAGEISEKLGRGRHTTRHVELFRAGEGWICDTPGFSSLELDQLGILPEETILGYPEFEIHASGCRFPGCRHIQEPDCAVRRVVCDHPELNPRYERYILFRELLEAQEPWQLRRRRELLPPPGLPMSTDRF
ncbi:MAG: ribosome small subunit-dependent GTPase A [Bacillota bacterium]|nr:ribosome small subunit-dependent GTPase A [Bacillota bacterium]